MEKTSFWSSVPGMITGIAGLLTGAAALLGLLLQVGVIGGSDKSSNEETPAADEGTPSTEQDEPAPSFSVEPTSVMLDQLLAKDAKIVVKNRGEAAMTVEPPVVRGGDAGQFAVRDLTCTDAEVPAGETCEMEVTFTPKTNGRHSATLVVTVAGGSKPSEVALRGSAVL